jgi:hypothetical protein
MGVDPQVQQLGAGQLLGVGPEGDPPGRVDLPDVAALPGGGGVQVVAGEGRDDPGVPELGVGELAGVVGASDNAATSATATTVVILSLARIGVTT